MPSVANRIVLLVMLSFFVPVTRSMAWESFSSIPSGEFEGEEVELSLPDGHNQGIALTDSREFAGATALVLRIDVGIGPREWDHLYVYNARGTLIEIISQEDVPESLGTIWSDVILGSEYRLGIEAKEGQSASVRITGIAIQGLPGQFDSVDSDPSFEPLDALSGEPLAASIDLLAALIIDPNDKGEIEEALFPADVCSGMMIAPDLLLTAAHCLQFRRSFCNGTIVIVGLHHGATSSPQVRRCIEVVYLGHSIDATVLKLDGQQSDGPFPKLPSVGTMAGMKVRILQHPGGNIARVARDGDCVIKQPIARLWPWSTEKHKGSAKIAGLTHTCDTMSGSSGAALLSEDGKTILGVHNAGNDNEGINYATRGDLIRYCIGYVSFDNFVEQPDDILCK